MIEMIDIALPRLYDKNMVEQGRIIPSKVSYDLQKDPLSTAKVEVEDSPIVASARQFIELFDVAGSIGIFRVQSIDIDRERSEVHRYYLEHGICTLGDKAMSGYRQFGGTGINTRSVLEALLDLQVEERWVLGQCDFSYQYQYSFENENLLTAFISIPTCFEDEYMWTFDQSGYPWTVNLIAAPAGNASEFRFNRNLKSVKVSIDDSSLCTRIIPKGSGEGENQVSIKSVNGGVEYLDADTQDEWGIVEKIWPDTTFTDPALLKRVALRVLNRIKEPVMTVSIDGEDVYPSTGESLDRFYVGRIANAPLEGFGVTMNARVCTISKGDVYGKNQDVKLVLANRNGDAVDDMAELVRKATIGQLYSQGATNVYAEHGVDNADADHPMELKFYIDEACVQINKVLLKYSLGSFRAYSKSAESAGETANTTGTGGGSTQTSSAGGYQNITKPISVYIDSATTGNPLDQVSAYSKTTTDFEAEEQRKTSVPSTTYTGAKEETTTASSGSLTTNSGGDVATGASDNTMHSHTMGGSRENTGNTSGSASHSHYMYHTHAVNGNTCSHLHTGGVHTHNINGHTHSIPAHYHSLNSHKHSIPLHNHGMNHFHMCYIVVRIPQLEIDVKNHTHSVSIPSHSHTMSIPSHTHSIEYGIYEGGSASSVSVKVDGNAVPSSALSGSELDIIAWMSKGDDGKITRNSWHSVQITPNALTRIVVDLFVKTFIRSIGGGNY